MDSVALVDFQIDEGQRLIDELTQFSFPIVAACWIKASDVDRWVLYLASPVVDHQGSSVAYSQISKTVSSLDSDWILGAEVHLVGSNHKLVEGAKRILRNYHHNRPISPPEYLNWGIPVEQLFVYATAKTDVTVYRIDYPGIPQVTGSLSFDPELLESHFSIEFENRGITKEFEGKTGIAGVVAAPINSHLERTQSGELQLVWDLRGTLKRSSASEVWSLANLGLHGFRMMKEPSEVVKTSVLQV